MEVSLRHVVGFVAFSAVVLLGLPKAEAQNYERYKPLGIQSVPSTGSASFSRERLDAVTGNDKTLVDALNAVIILDSPQKVDVENAHEGYQGIEYNFDDTSSPVYRLGVRNIVRRYLGSPVTLRRLNQMSRDIILHYRKSGQPVVDVVIPEQKITSGVVQIVVTEARVGRVTLSDGCYFEAENLCKWVQCTKRGNRVYESHLNTDLWWLNQNPFRRVSVDLSPGACEGTTDVNFKVKDVFPIRAYLGYEDTGVRSLGLERLYAGVMYGNMFGRDGTMSYQYTADAKFDRLNAHSLSYFQPINRKWSWNVFGSWAEVTPSFGLLTQEGESWQVGTGITRHLTRNQWQDTSLIFGFDFKHTDNNLEFGGQNVQASAADLVQLRLGFYHLKRKCNDQYYFVYSDSFIGPGGGFTSDHNSAAFNTIRANTAPDYFYTRLRAERLWKVKNDWVLLGRFAGQLSSDRLLFSETLGFGGYDSIRGYDQRILNADSGWLGSIEVGPPIRRCGDCTSPNTFRMFGFVDAGTAYVRDPVPGEFDDQFLISAGVGMRYSLSDRMSLRAGYGHGFKSLPGIASRDRVHIGLVSLFGPRP